MLCNHFSCLRNTLVHMKLPHKGSSELEQPFTSTASVAGCHSPVCQHLTAPDSPKSRFANFYRTNSPLTTDAKAIRTYTRRTYTHTRVVLFPCFQGPTPPAQGREHQLTDCGQSMHMKTAYIGHTHRPPCWRTAVSASTRTTSPHLRVSMFACLRGRHLNDLARATFN